MARIDLVQQFAVLVAQLQASVIEGGILHGTSNIREAGGPFERRFREILGSRLPHPFRVSTGYLFDGHGNVTPQIDAIISDPTGSHEILNTPDGSSYLPYPHANVAIEIKNSVRSPKSALEQIRRAVNSLINMRQRAIGHVPQLDPWEPPLTMLVIGDSSRASLSAFQKQYARIAGADPVFTYFVDRGILIARDADIPGIIEFPPERDFLERRDGAWWIYSPQAGSDDPKGLMLLWVYFAIIAHMKNVGTTASAAIYDEFIRAIALTYKVVKDRPLLKATGWP